MRDSQSLLEQLLAVGRQADHGRRRAISCWASRRPSGSAGWCSIWSTATRPRRWPSSTRRSHGGVEVGLLLDQLVGYFRDVMAAGRRLPAASRCSTPCRRRPRKSPTIGRQLGLPTILAMVQILDQTAARLRVSMHGRTLVEMAIVRICQLGDLDDLATLVAELRGTAANRRRSRRRRPRSANRLSRR